MDARKRNEALGGSLYLPLAALSSREMDDNAMFLELLDVDEAGVLLGLEALERELPTCQWCSRMGMAEGKMGEVLVRVCDGHKTPGAKDLPFAKLLRALLLWRRMLKSERPTIPDMEEQRRRGH